MAARRSTFLGCVALFSLFATRYSGPFHAIAFGSKSPDSNFPLALAVTSIWSCALTLSLDSRTRQNACVWLSNVAPASWSPNCVAVQNDMALSSQ